MNKLFKDIGCSRSWLGAFDLFGAGAITQGVMGSAATMTAAGLNYDAQIKTNESNERNVDETNKANKEMVDATNAANIQIQQMANDLQVAESEKAYQRSTATNQIAELVRAGYSTQQAKQIVAAGGSPAMYTPAQIGAATLTAPQAQAFQATAPNLDAAAMGQATQQLFGTLGDAYSAPDGGSAGAIYASGALAFLSENASDIDDLSGHSINTFMDFENWAKNQDEDSEYRQFVESKTWKRCKHYLPSMRSINSHMKNIFAENRTTSQQILAAQKDIDNKALQNRVAKVTAEIAENGQALEFLKQKAEMLSVPYLTLDDISRAINSITRLSLDTEISSNSKYRAKALELALQDQRTQLVTSEVLELFQKIKKSGYNSLTAEEKSFMGIVSIYGDSGVTDTDFGAAAALAAGAGHSFIPSLKNSLSSMFGFNFESSTQNDSDNDLSVGESTGDPILDARSDKGVSEQEDKIVHKAARTLWSWTKDALNAQGTSYR